MSDQTEIATEAGCFQDVAEIIFILVGHCSCQCVCIQPSFKKKSADKIPCCEEFTISRVAVFPILKKKIPVVRGINMIVGGQ